MTAKEALSYLVATAIYGNKENNRGKIFEAENTIEQSLTELEELKEFISDIFTDKELNQWLFDNRINVWVYIKNKNEVKE